MEIVYGEPRTGSHFIARHISNQYNKIFLGEYFKSSFPNAQFNILGKIYKLPKNSVIIVHPDLAYGHYCQEFYNWLFSNELIVTQTDDRWRQVVSWGFAAKTTNWHSYSNPRNLDQKITYSRKYFDMLKVSINKFNDTKHLIKIKEMYKLQDIEKISFSQGKYKKTAKTYFQDTDDIAQMYKNLNEVKSWFNEIREIK